MTHALTVLRGAMLEAKVSWNWRPDPGTCRVSLSFFVIGLMAFAATVRHGRVDGSLAQY